jgi:hypothetical protein
MANLWRIRVAWSGAATTGAGVSTYYWNAAATGGPAALVTFYNAIKNFFPTSVTWTIPNSGDILEDSTGVLTGAWSFGTGGVVTGAASGSNWVQGAGARMVWNTNGITGGRRVRGSTFFTSMNAIEFQVDGTPQATTVAAFNSAATTMLGGVPAFTIWSRPIKHKPITVPPTYDRLGSSNLITTPAFKDAASWLRSRRT